MPTGPVVINVGTSRSRDFSKVSSKIEEVVSEDITFEFHVVRAHTFPFLDLWLQLNDQLTFFTAAMLPF